MQFGWRETRYSFVRKPHGTQPCGRKMEKDLKKIDQNYVNWDELVRAMNQLI
jgi:hypothetical protein